jgi:hypothetical protein
MTSSGTSEAGVGQKMNSYKKVVSVVVSVVVVVVYLSLSLSLSITLSRSSRLSHLLIGSHGRLFKMALQTHSNKNVYRGTHFSAPSESSGTNLRKALRNHKLRLSHLDVFCVPVSHLPRISTTAL